jgi:hypothetical protein
VGGGTGIPERQGKTLLLELLALEAGGFMFGATQQTEEDMCGRAGPRSLEELDPWVQRRLLNPASAMFREGALLLREEPSIADPTSYASVLAAISAGASRRSEIAATLARPVSCGSTRRRR